MIVGGVENVTVDVIVGSGNVLRLFGEELLKTVVPLGRALDVELIFMFSCDSTLVTPASQLNVMVLRTSVGPSSRTVAGLAVVIPAVQFCAEAKFELAKRAKNSPLATATNRRIPWI